MQLPKTAKRRLVELVSRSGQLETLAAPLQSRIVVWVLSFIVLLNGLIAWAFSFSHWLPRGLEDLLPIDVDRLTRYSGVFAGLLLIYFSRQLLTGKRLALYVAATVSIGIGLIHIVGTHNVLTSIIPFATAALLIVNRHHFRIKSNTDNLSQGALLALISFGIAILYGWIGFRVLHERDFGTTFSLSEAFVRTIRELTLFGNDDLVAHTRYAQWFLNSVDFAGTLSALLVAYSLFRPLRYKLATLPAERQEARDLLELHGGTSEDYFKLWPEDKAYFFDTSHENFIAYKTVDGVCLSLGGPAGKNPISSNIMGQFQSFCHENGWTSSFVHIDDIARAQYKKLGYTLVKVGEEAIIDLKVFATKTAQNKHFRYVERKFLKSGHSVELLKPPLSSDIITELKHVSDSWLKLPNHQDRSFALGYFSPNYIGHCPVMIVRSSRGHIEAFTNIIPSYDKQEANIDLFRNRESAPTNTNDFLLMQLMLALHAEGTLRLNLGLAPLAGMKDVDNPSAKSRIAAFIYTNGGHFYSFKGLRRFKQKFEPEWQNRYIAYHSSTGSLLRTALALYRAMKL